MADAAAAIRQRAHHARRDSIGETHGRLASLMKGFDEIYERLKSIAHSELARHAGNTLNTTALVHEAYLKLAQIDPEADRNHRISLVTRAMRQVLIDAARRRASEKHGGICVSLETIAGAQSNGDGVLASSAAAESFELLAFEQALTLLSEQHPRMARALELSVFGGADAAEVAAILGVNLRTAQRDLLAAQTLVIAQLRA